MNEKKAFIKSTIIKSIVIPLLIVALTAGVFYISLDSLESKLPTAKQTQSVQSEGSGNE